MGGRRIVIACAVVLLFASCRPLRSLDERGPLECPVHVGARTIDPACAALDGSEDDESACSDGCDNDGDGFIDCGDDGCAGVADAYCADSSESSLARCRDGADNNRDMRIDCRDPGCFMSTDPDIVAYCALSQENDGVRCQDGIDNDLNGFIDCHDFLCQLSSEPSLAAHCADAAEVTAERCSDGVDNDGDGTADCGDPECRSGGFCTDVYEGTLETCSDGVDNDGDGASDCEDPDCVYAPRFDARSLCDAVRCGDRECGIGPCGYPCGGACAAGSRCTEEGRCAPL